MFKKMKYFKIWFLSKVTRGEVQAHYKVEKRTLQKQLYPQKAMYGLLKKLENSQAFFQYYLMFKQKDGIELPAEVCGLGNYFELIRIKLKDIRRPWLGKSYSLDQCSQYRYLKTKDKKIYQEYTKRYMKIGFMDDDSLTWNIDRFDHLVRSLEKTGYNPQKSVIVVNQNNEICDGLHRACFLMHKYGGEHEIIAVRVKNI